MRWMYSMSLHVCMKKKRMTWGLFKTNYSFGKTTLYEVLDEVKNQLYRALVCFLANFPCETTQMSIIFHTLFYLPSFFEQEMFCPPDNKRKKILSQLRTVGCSQTFSALIISSERLHTSLQFKHSIEWKERKDCISGRENSRMVHTKWSSFL